MCVGVCERVCWRASELIMGIRKVERGKEPVDYACFAFVPLNVCVYYKYIDML